MSGKHKHPKLTVKAVTQRLAKTRLAAVPQKQERKVPRLPTSHVGSAPQRMATGAMYQELRNQVASKGVKGYVKATLQALTLPHDAEPVRWNTRYSNRPTVVARPFQAVDMPNDGTSTFAGNESYPSANENVVFWGRSGLCAYIMYDANSGAKVSTYNGLLAVNNSTPAASVLLYIAPAPAPMPLRYMSCSTAFKPHGSTQYCASTTESPGLRFVWIDSLATSKSILSFKITPAAAYTGTYTGTLIRWVPSESITEIEAAVNIWTAGASTYTATFNIAAAGYYAVCNSATNAAGFTVTAYSVEYPSDMKFWCHRAMRGIGANINVVSDMRVNAASAMMSNGTPELFRGGFIVGVQLPEGTNSYWTSVVGASVFDSISGVADNVQKTADKGMYGYLKAVTARDHEFLSETGISPDNGTTSALLDSHWSLERNTQMGCIAMRMPVQVSTAEHPVTPQVVRLTMGWGIEYVTTDVWRQASRADPALENAQAEAEDHIRFIVQFTENPLHFREILNKIKQIAGTVLRGVIDYGPGVIRGATTLAGML